MHLAFRILPCKLSGSIGDAIKSLGLNPEIFLWLDASRISVFAVFNEYADEEGLRNKPLI